MRPGFAPRRVEAGGGYALSIQPPRVANHVADQWQADRNFEAEADGVTTDAIILRLVEHVPHETEETAEESQRAQKSAKTS